MRIPINIRKLCVLIIILQKLLNTARFLLFRKVFAFTGPAKQRDGDEKVHFLCFYHNINLCDSKQIEKRIDVLIVDDQPYIPELPGLYVIKDLDAIFRLKQTITKMLSLKRSVSLSLRKINSIKDRAQEA